MDPDKLAKVLAMAESDHQGEALSALRAARIMLSRAGLSFRDLAQIARNGASAAEPPPIIVTPTSRPQAPVQPPPPDELVLSLRRQVRELEAELSDVRRQLDKAAGDAERQREEADRWKALARDTAEKLWDMGKALERKHSHHASIDKRRAVLELLQDPGSALLSDREIGRRVGLPARQVGHWRRRLAIVGRKLRLLPVVSRGRGLWGAVSGRSPALEGQRQRWLSFPVEVTIAERGGSRQRLGPAVSPSLYGTRR